ncbi:GGDEF domain-containing phosphodiesterase [Bacillaceae bacterium IKA-2]|nr:GGDEF domain-containing phosphodiesterase [Bacillaceae bacterium IKA-2]
MNGPLLEYHKQFSERLQIFVDKEEIIGRYFGDEFIILLKEESAEKLQYRIQQLWLETSTEMIIKENEYRLKVSMGVATSDSFQIDIETMINEANISKLQAKKVGGNRFQFYDTKMAKIINFEQEVENALYHAIENSELYLVYQPIVDINTNKIVGTEALIRWNNQRFSDVSIPKLIEIAEQSGLIIDIGKWVLTEALRQNKFWQNAGFKPMFVSVNISVLQFDQANFIDIVGQAVREIGIAPKYIELEITESTAMAVVTEKLEKMQRLKEMGINIAIDDFGTGYSSLAYFTKFPISTLKIDRSFVKDISNDESAKTVITTIISLAKAIGISTTAEGVEYEDQKQFLKEMGCVKMQGYLISKPVGAEKLEQLLEKI